MDLPTSPIDQKPAVDETHALAEMNKKLETTHSAIAAMRPELRSLFEASWAHNQAAYRHLGR